MRHPSFKNNAGIARPWRFGFFVKLRCRVAGLDLLWQGTGTAQLRAARQRRGAEVPSLVADMQAGTKATRGVVRFKRAHARHRSSCHRCPWGAQRRSNAILKCLLPSIVRRPSIRNPVASVHRSARALGGSLGTPWGLEALGGSSAGWWRPVRPCRNDPWLAGGSRWERTMKGPLFGRRGSF